MKKLFVLCLLYACIVFPQSQPKSASKAHEAHACSQITATIAALNAIDKFEANYETWPPRTDHAGGKARLAVNKVSDLMFHGKLELVMTDAEIILVANMDLGLDGGEKANRKMKESIIQYRNDRSKLMDFMAE